MTSLEIKRFNSSASPTKKQTVSESNEISSTIAREIPIVILKKSDSTGASSANTLSNSGDGENEQMEFNKYGFLQPVASVNSSNNTLVRNGTIDKRSTKSGSVANTVDTNSLSYKELIQSTPVEYFAESLPIEVILTREQKWLEMLKNYDDWVTTKYSKLKQRCRKGIPQSVRGRAWMYLSGACLLKDKYKTYYHECLQSDKVEQKVRDEIRRDLHRQFPSHEIFRTQSGIDSLYNVLYAYAAHNPEVGYCQSQGPIAAVLLMNMPEEDAFWMLHKISDFYLKDYFKPDLEKIQIDGLTLFKLFKDVNPLAYKLMKAQCIHPTIYMTEWFMCIFARTLPWCTVLRVWDMFFCEGVKVLYRVGLYLLKSIFMNKEKFKYCQRTSGNEQQYALYTILKDIDMDNLKETLLVKETLKFELSEDKLKSTYKKAKEEFKSTMNPSNSNKKTKK